MTCPKLDRLIDLAEENGWEVERHAPARVEGCTEVAGALLAALGPLDLDGDGEVDYSTSYAIVVGIGYGRNERSGRWALLVDDETDHPVVGMAGDDEFFLYSVKALEALLVDPVAFIDEATAQGWWPAPRRLASRSGE